MRQITNLFSQKNTVRSIAFIVMSFVSIVVIPVAVFAYGPDRPTFTQAQPATYVTFDSITDDPTYGDERNFFRVRNLTDNKTFEQDANLVPGKEYEAMIFYHNNASSSLNQSGVGIAHGAYARVELPAVVKAHATGTEAEAFIGASNANPKMVFDYFTMQNQTATDISLRYVPGTAVIHNKGMTNGTSLGDTALFSSSGKPLGFDSLNGDLPGCDQYSGWITFAFKAVQPNFTFKKEVRQAGTTGWHDSVTVKKSSTVEYLLSYENTGTINQLDVKLKDILPVGLTYLPGKTKLYDDTNPNGAIVGNGIANGGIDIGNYAPGGSAYLSFEARVDADPCSILKNTASVETDNGNRQDSAVVTVSGTCAALPTTGPVEVVAGLVGVAAITLGVVYYFRSRRDLESALHNARVHTSTGPSLLDVDSDMKDDSEKFKDK
ncbi:MAG: DUF11 domain-containing protein [Candidatus Nomurabacteria bacterium]|nr:MAG: DUF11 domain-containing protein [Candidatus Nomurabacteria bacterium]